MAVAAATRPDPVKARLAAWRADPVLFVREAIRATPQPWQADALRAIRDNDRVAIRSGHGVGKSAMLAWAILWWHCTRFPAKTAASAPTAHQLEDILWSELATWHRRLPAALAGQFRITSDSMVMNGEEKTSFAVARTARKEQPEAFQGFHSPNMLFIADEASGIEDIIFEVGQGAMSTVGAKTVMTGNPTRSSGYFFDAFHKARAQWQTMKVACADSTLVKPSYADEVALAFGRDGNVYRVRVLGDFPLAEDDVVIPLHLCEAALNREVKADKAFRVVWGVDVARFGDDRSALAKRRGNVLLEPVLSWHGLDIMQTVGRIVDIFKATDDQDKPSEIVVDAIGLGAGVADRLNELGMPARGLNVGEAPSAKGRYLRKRDELYFAAREWFDDRDCVIPEDDALIAELTSAKYTIESSGKVRVERKDEMKKRGLRSPDLADAFIMTFAGGLDRVADRTMDKFRSRLHTRRHSAWAA